MTVRSLLGLAAAQRVRARRRDRAALGRARLALLGRARPPRRARVHARRRRARHCARVGARGRRPVLARDGAARGCWRSRSRGSARDVLLAAACARSARLEHSQGLALMAAAFAALIVVYLEALFRAGRLAGLYAWDAWAFWVPKAKMIYFFGGLDDAVLQRAARIRRYPPLRPGTRGLRVPLHGLGGRRHPAPPVLVLPRRLRRRRRRDCWRRAVPQLLLWPFLLLVLVAPRVVGRTLEPQADFLLDYLFALAALLVALWLLERRAWQLASATLFLGAAMLTKREG